MVAQSSPSPGGRPQWIRFLAGLVAVAVLLLNPWTSSSFWAWSTHLIVPLLFIPLLPLVSYRRRDWLFLAFVPVWNVVVAARVGWRLANLPERDWPPRPDEAGYGAWTDSHPERERTEFAG